MFLMFDLMYYVLFDLLIEILKVFKLETLSNVMYPNR